MFNDAHIAAPLMGLHAEDGVVEGTHPETFPASVNTKIKPRPMENKETLET
jgi:hypothetical protein